ncbi:MAG: (deoxy)nucleoside triphosphate pyrophosphohydrolase [Candidatus Aminicenantes bacterium]|nr:(deoxy)nucleoside triphosphate pyrophosphohydrolase [Candidatus Aminicenantes bacterium]
MKKVTAAVIERRGKVLIARRKAGGAQAGKWEFPGGTLERGETPAQCLARELREELGIQCRVGDLLAAGRGPGAASSFELLVFRIRDYEGSVRPLVHVEVRWVSPRDLASYDLAEADAWLLPRILAGLAGGAGEAGQEKK